MNWKSSPGRQQRKEAARCYLVELKRQPACEKQYYLSTTCNNVEFPLHLAERPRGG